MDGILAELVLQFSQQGSLPLLKMVAHGWLKHLDGGYSLDNGKKVGLLAQEWPRSFQPSFPEQFGVHAVAVQGKPGQDIPQQGLRRMEVACFTGGGGYLEPVRQRLPHLLLITGKTGEA